MPRSGRTRAISPGGALVGEWKRLVVVKGIDDVFVRQWLQHEQIRQARPVRAGCDDGVGGRDFADGLDDGGLDALPAVRVVLLRFVQNLEEDVLGIDRSEVRGELSPERGEVC